MSVSWAEVAARTEFRENPGQSLENPHLFYRPYTMESTRLHTDHPNWKSPDQLTLEDRLLLAYWKEAGGLLITEVPIGSPSKSIWPEGSRVRRIDGVRILDPGDKGNQIASFQSTDAGRFEEWVKGRQVEVLEAKAKLNRLVLGQVIVGADMFRIEYGASDILSVVVVGIGDPGLELICEHRGIRCWFPPSSL